MVQQTPVAAKVRFWVGGRRQRARAMTRRQSERDGGWGQDTSFALAERDWGRRRQESAKCRLTRCSGCRGVKRWSIKPARSEHRCPPAAREAGSGRTTVYRWISEPTSCP